MIPEHGRILRTHHSLSPCPPVVFCGGAQAFDLGGESWRVCLFPTEEGRLAASGEALTRLLIAIPVVLLFSLLAAFHHREERNESEARPAPPLPIASKPGWLHAPRTKKCACCLTSVAFSQACPAFLESTHAPPPQNEPRRKTPC